MKDTDEMSEAANNENSNASNGEKTAREQIEAIKQENLSGQQMRMARRLAQKHGLKAVSDLDAVRVLRENGIDPFANLNNPLGAAIAAQDNERLGSSNNPKLPAVQKQKTDLDKPKTLSEGERAVEVMQIQRDLLRRRRLRILQLCTRLFFFILVPTILAGYYFSSVATPLYSAKSEFSIQSAGGNSIEPNASLLGGFMDGAKEGISVQSHLLSMESMLRLDADHGFISIFQDESIDPIQRLEPNASNEAAHKLYEKHVKIGFDPTEGVLRMEVIAPSPQNALDFSNSLLVYAEERLDAITRPVREDQLRASRELYEDAEAKLAEARAKVLDLQTQRGVISGDLEVQVLMGQITNLETSLLERRLSLAEIEANTRPNPAKKTALENQIAELEKVIAESRSRLTNASDQDSSIAVISGELTQAQSEVELRQQLLTQSILGLESATIEAAKQSKFLGLSVRPVLPQSPSYPRAFEMTMISFFVFLGIYLMIALTGSILREQMSS